MVKFQLKQFSVDTIFPAIQTAATTILSTQILGRLGHFTVSPQTTVLLSAVAATVSEITRNIFLTGPYKYLAIPVGVAAGSLVHRFFYPRIPLEAVIDVKGFLIITTLLIAARAVADNFQHVRRKIDFENMEIAE